MESGMQCCFRIPEQLDGFLFWFRLPGRIIFRFWTERTCAGKIEVHSTRPGYIYQPLVGSDDFCNGLLPRWQFNHDPDPRYYHLDALQGTYTITTREVCTELTQAVNTLTQG